MAATTSVPQNDIDAYDAALEVLADTGDDRCIPLLLNSFGEGDLHGVYAHVEDVLGQFEPEKVVPHLKTALGNQSSAIRYWCAQIAANFPSRDITNELMAIAKDPSFDLRAAAVNALDGIDGDDVTQFLTKLQQSESDVELRSLIEEVLANRA